MTQVRDATPDTAPPALPAAVLWDMDGTLVDTEPYWFASERDIVEQFGNEWPDHHAHAMIGFDLLDSAAYMQEHGGVDLPAREIVDRLLDGVVARLHRRIPWRPGARELLADLNDAGVPCGLVTMAWRRFADPVLAALPPGSFVASITGDELPEGMGKPDPEPFIRGAEACGADPADCVAIEDSPTGVRSALAAGCRVIGVPNIRDLDPAASLVVIESLEGVRVDDLPELMARADEGSEAPQRSGLEFNRRTWMLIALAVISVLVVAVAATRGAPPGGSRVPPSTVDADRAGGHQRARRRRRRDRRRRRVRDRAPAGCSAHRRLGALLDPR